MTVVLGHGPMWGLESPIPAQNYPQAELISPVARQPLSQTVPELYLTSAAYHEAERNLKHLVVGESALRLAQVTLDDSTLTPADIRIVIHSDADDPDELRHSVPYANFQDYLDDKPNGQAGRIKIVMPAGDWSMESLLAGYLVGLERAAHEKLREEHLLGGSLAYAGATAEATALLLNQPIATALVAALGAGAMGHWWGKRETLKHAIRDIGVNARRANYPLFSSPKQPSARR